jgi:tetratricopeptide (TPR) repeat protein
LFVEKLAAAQSELGADHPLTLSTQSQLGRVRHRLGQTKEALADLQEAYRLSRAKLGPDHPDTLTTLSSLANVMRDTGQLAEAADLQAEALALRRTKLGESHPETVENVGTLAFLQQDLGRHEQALPLFAEMYKLAPILAGGESAWLDVALSNLADAQLYARRYAEAEASYRQLLDNYRSRPGPAGTDAGNAQAGLGYCLLLQNEQLDEAEKLLRDAVQQWERSQNDHWALFDMKSRLGAVLLAQASQLKSASAAGADAKFQEAETLLLSGYEGLSSRRQHLQGHRQTRLTEALVRLHDLYVSWDRPQEAEKWQSEIDRQAIAQPAAAAVQQP